MKNNNIGCFGWLVLLFCFGLVLAYWYIFLIIIVICTLIYWIYSVNQKKKKSKQTNSPKIINAQEKSSKSVQAASVDKDHSLPIEKNSDNEFQDPNENIQLSSNLQLSDILFLNWLNGKDINEPVPGYIVNRFSINPIVEKKKLKSENYVKEGSISWRLNKLKVPDLKNILRKNNQKVSGRKSELIQRIQNNIQLQKYVDQLPHVFELSDKGSKLINKYNLIIWAHSNSWLIPPKEFLPYIDSDKSNIEISISLHEEKLIKIIKSASFNDYYEFERYEDYLADLYDKLNNEEKYVEHTINGAFLDYFLINSLNSRYYFEPDYYDTFQIQSKIIDLIQKIPEMNDLILQGAIATFIKDYSNILPEYVKNNSEQMLNALKDAINLSPQELHHKRLINLKRYITFESTVK